MTTLVLQSNHQDQETRNRERGPWLHLVPRGKAQEREDLERAVKAFTSRGGTISTYDEGSDRKNGKTGQTVWPIRGFPVYANGTNCAGSLRAYMPREGLDADWDAWNREQLTLEEETTK